MQEFVTVAKRAGAVGHPMTVVQTLSYGSLVPIRRRGPSASAAYAKRAVRLSEERRGNEDLSAFPKEVAIIGRLLNRGRPGGHHAPVRRRGMTIPQFPIMPRLEHRGTATMPPDYLSGAGNMIRRNESPGNA